MTSERLTVVLWDYDINTYMFWLYTDMYTVRWTFWTALLIVDILQLFSWTQRAIINHHVFKATVSLLQNILYRAFDGFLTLSPLPISLFFHQDSLSLSLSLQPHSSPIPRIVLLYPSLWQFMAQWFSLLHRKERRKNVPSERLEGKRERKSRLLMAGRNTSDA